MDKKTIIIIFMSVIILVGAGVCGYKEIKNHFYQMGVQDATLLINKQIISNLIQNGFIVVYVPVNETSTIPIKLIPQKNE